MKKLSLLILQTAQNSPSHGMTMVNSWNHLPPVLIVTFFTTAWTFTMVCFACTAYYRDIFNVKAEKTIHEK